MSTVKILRNGELVDADDEFLAQQAIDATVDLPALKRRLKSDIDAAAEAERLKYITPGAGQAMTYQAKVEEARRIADDPAPDPAEHPLLSAEIGITAASLTAVGGTVMAAYQQWIQVGALIEAARLGAKQAIDAADTADAAREVQPIWPEANNVG